MVSKISRRTAHRPLLSSALFTPHILARFMYISPKTSTYRLVTNTLSVTLILVTNTVVSKVAKLKTHNCLICVSPNVVPNIVFISNVPLVNFSEGRLGRIGEGKGRLHTRRSLRYYQLQSSCLLRPMDALESNLMSMRKRGLLPHALPICC